MSATFESSISKDESSYSQLDRDSLFSDTPELPDSPEIREIEGRVAYRLFSSSSTLAGSTPDDDRERRTERVENTRIGRYQILELIGYGGMGEVYRAYDTRLRCDVAIKLIRRGVFSQDANERFMREAQALARLRSCEEVVKVYEADVHRDRLYIAMELVDGVSLSAWLRAKQRSWREIVRVFVDAGRGLAAAHAAGLVHRDFKPDNVLVHHDGRVKVTDFGLTYSPAEECTEVSGEVTLRVPSQLEARLTHTGAVFGTVGYMAPEQYTTSGVDARCDQFSYCVALFRALYGGDTPFLPPTRSKRSRRSRRADENVTTVPDPRPETDVADVYAAARANLSGAVRPPPRGSAVPRRVYRALRRGLSFKPADRFPTMAALLAELTRDPFARARRWFPLAAAFVAIPSGVLGYNHFVTNSCSNIASTIDNTWNDERAESVRARFEDSGRPFAAASFGTVKRVLNEYTRDWVISRERACTDRRALFTTAPAVEQRIACLDRKQHVVEAFVEQLERADAAAIDEAVERVFQLPEISECDNEQIILHTCQVEGLEGIDRMSATRVRDKLDKGEAAARRGDREKAERLTRDALSLAESTEQSALIAEAGLALGALLMDYGRPNEVAEHLLLALGAAERAGCEAKVVEIQSQLAQASALDYVLSPESARLLVDSGAERVERIQATERLKGALRTAQGLLAQFAEQSPKTAEQHLRGALDAYRLSASGRLGEADTYSRLGRLYVDNNRLEEGLTALERAREIYQELLGEDHPRLIPNLRGQGRALVQLERYADAEEVYTRALELSLEDGRATYVTAKIHTNFRQLYARQAEHERALHHVKLADSIVSDLGKQRAQVRVRRAIGQTYIDLNRYDEARTWLENALEILRGFRGREVEVEMAMIQAKIGYVDLQRGRYAEGLESLDSARRLLGDRLGDTPEKSGEVLVTRGELLQKLGRRDAARDDFEAAWTLLAEAPTSPELRAYAGWGYAQVLCTDDEERARGRGLAEKARRVLRSTGDHGARTSEEIGLWLRAQCADAEQPVSREGEEKNSQN